MVLGYVWFFYARQNNINVTLGGNMAPKAENSDQNADGFNMARNFNNSIQTAKAIQWYICNNTDGNEYPEFNGQSFRLLTGL